VSNQEAISSSTFQNDHLTVEVTRHPNCLVKFEIQVAPKATEAAYLKACKMINKEVVIPGFRKGRAPDQIIQEKYSSHIQKEFVDVVLQTGFNEAVSLSKTFPLKEGRIDRPKVADCDRHKGAKFSIQFECRPEVPSIDLKEIQIQKPTAKPVSNQQRENALQQIRIHYTTYDPVEDRPVQEDDFVDLSVMILDNPPRLAIDNQRAQVTANGLPAWIRKKIIGLKVGEQAEGMTEEDPTNPSQSEFKPIPFQVTINAIWQGHIPEADDELAKRVGMDSIDQLNQKIDERIINENKEDAYREEVQALENVLIEKYPFEVPQSYIDYNRKQHLDNYHQELKERKLPVPKETNEELKVIEQNIVNNLKLFFLLNKFAAEHKIKVTHEEVTAEFSKQIALIPSGRSNIDLSHDKEQIHEQLQSIAFDRKVKEYILSHLS
jgi:trigger factor